MEVFSIEGVLRSAWEKFKSHFLYMWILGGVYAAVAIFLSLLGDQLEGGPFELAAVVLSIVVGTLVQLGFIKGMLDLVSTNTEQGVGVLFSQSKVFWRYLVASILYQIVVVIGFILLIIPGVYLMLRLQFFSYLIVDKNLGIMEAFKKSSEMTEGIKWKLLGFGVVLMLLNVLGALFFIVGLLVTVPVSILACVYVYYALLNRSPERTIAESVVTPPSSEIPPVSGSTA